MADRLPGDLSGMVAPPTDEELDYTPADRDELAARAREYRARKWGAHEALAGVELEPAPEGDCDDCRRPDQTRFVYGRVRVTGGFGPRHLCRACVIGRLTVRDRAPARAGRLVMNDTNTPGTALATRDNGGSSA